MNDGPKVKKMSKIKRLMDHHNIGHICAYNHAHKIINEYNKDGYINYDTL